MSKTHASFAGGLVKTDINSLIDYNSRFSEYYISQQAERNRYRGEHPTEIAALKCMDGRLHLQHMTQTAPGIIQPFRNLGGKFDTGWPLFQLIMGEWISYSQSRGRHNLILVTYHFSRGDVHRGCAGFLYDTATAKAAQEKLRHQFVRIYGQTAVYPVVVGIETDREAFVLIGEGGEEVDLSEISGTGTDQLRGLLQRLYPNMAERIARDFLPLIEGNIRHSRDVVAMNRPVADTEHKEKLIVIGRGVDLWLSEPNTAFIVGPFDPDTKHSVEKEAGLLLKNVEKGIVGEDELVLLTSAPYRSLGIEQRQAEDRALFYTSLGLQIINERVPDLMRKHRLQVLTTTLNLQNRRMDVVNRHENAVELFKKKGDLVGVA